MPGEPWRPWQPGDDPLEVRYMTPEQVADLVARVRAGQDEVRRRASVSRRAPSNSKLSDEAVAAIRAARAAGTRLRTIAAEHGISVAHASRVASGARRADVHLP